MYSQTLELLVIIQTKENNIFSLDFSIFLKFSEYYIEYLRSGLALLKIMCLIQLDLIVERPENLLLWYKKHLKCTFQTHVIVFSPLKI